MTKSLGNDLGVDPGFEGQRGVGVAQIVQPDRWQPRLSAQPDEEVGEAVRMQRCAVLTGEDQTPSIHNLPPCWRSALLSLLVCTKHLDRPGVEGDPAPALVGLGRRPTARPLTVVIVETIDKRPASRSTSRQRSPIILTSTHSGGGREHERCEETMVGDRCEESAQLLRRPGRLLLAPDRRRSSGRSRVAHHQVETLRICECASQHRVRVAHRLGGQARAQQLLIRPLNGEGV